MTFRSLFGSNLRPGGTEPHAFEPYRFAGDAPTSLCAYGDCPSDDLDDEIPTDAFRRHPIHDLRPVIGPLRRWIAHRLGA